MMEKTFPLVIQVSSGVELMVGEGPISSACALSGMAIPAASSAKAMAEATSNTPSLFLLKTILLLVEGRDACRPALQSSSGPSCAPLGGDASARWPISSHLWHISERRQGGLTHRGYAGDLARRPPSSAASDDASGRTNTIPSARSTSTASRPRLGSS